MGSLLALLYEVAFFNYAFFWSLAKTTVDSRNNYWNVPCVWGDNFTEIYRGSTESRAKIRNKLNESQRKTFDQLQQIAKEKHARLTANHNQLKQPPQATTPTPTQAEMRDLAEGLANTQLPQVIQRANQSSGHSPVRNWSNWCDIGYLDGSHFPEAHPNFRACFKPGNYVAKYNSKTAKDGQQWLLSLDTSLDGQYGETDSYPHYSIFFSEDNSQIAKEHFTCAQKVRFKLDHNLGRLENATRNFNSQIKVQILPEHPEIDPATLEPYL